ncbi:MAG: hypothetical protein F4X16_07510 [Caldilineaceae bacterium SB0661_bin_34]|nr:hypothetical protein [Caldilineaceae bacterium SB0661_bin_34]
MAETYPGITNENSFFSDHYLSDLFAKDRQRWAKDTDAELASPADRRRLASLYLQGKRAYGAGMERGVLPRQAGEFQQALLEVLGYDRRPERVPVTIDNRQVAVPLLARVATSKEQDALWVVEFRDQIGDDEWGGDPLAGGFHAGLYPWSDEDELDLPDGNTTVEKVIEAGVFGQSRPPRWVMVVSLARIMLLDRVKWAEDRLLRFDLETIFTHPDAESFRTMQALLHRTSLAPTGEVRGMEGFDENSRLHAVGVSTDLKYAMQEAVELLGNEALRQYADRNRPVPSAEDLTRECLRYLYRLLFLFFAEAHPELGHAGMRSPVYQNGYSLETLRDAELVRLPDNEDSWFLHESLQTLFRMQLEGTPLRSQEILRATETHHDFVLEPVGSVLFEPEQTPHLDAVRFPDRVLRRVLELLSLSGAGTHRRKGRRTGRRGRGRISYAQLGVNQLGSVYEALLSFSGFIADQDLVEVKRAQDDKPDILERAWFVPIEKIDEYEDDEVVYDGNEPRIYHKGKFVYRQTGYDREATASFYTPESLTQATVRHALNELLKDRKADDILDIRILEPAMGSAAFLIEAVNQLADRYLRLKQREMGRTIPPEELPRERQRVRAYITARNAFGVDLNPVAQELGAMSLWLNCMEPGGFRPDFSHTLYTGNSIVGARRAVLTISKQRRGYKVDNDSLRELGFGDKRKDDEIYHFLLPVKEMTAVTRKELKALVPEAVKQGADWSKEHGRPFTDHEFAVLQELSSAIDELWDSVADKLHNQRAEYEATLPAVWPTKVAPIQDRAHRQSGFPDEYRRLKLALDYWCSLWFWPISVYGLLPSRNRFLLEMSLILTGRPAATEGTLSWVLETELEAVEASAVRTLLDDSDNPLEVDDLAEFMSGRLQSIKETSVGHRFLNWPLEFADILSKQSGFDLIIGNPPWVPLQWTEKEALAQHTPLIEIRMWSADRIARQRNGILETNSLNGLIFDARTGSARATFARHPHNYPQLRGISQNTYKLFLARSFDLIASNGAAGLVHPVNHFREPQGSILRDMCYRRLVLLLQFTNERSNSMFSDIGHARVYSTCIYLGHPKPVQFRMIANLFASETADECLVHDGAGPVPGIKDVNGDWQLKGHRSRVIEVDETVLFNFGSVLDPGKPPRSCRLPMLHSQELVASLLKITSQPQRLGNLQGEYLQDAMWDETGDRKTDPPVFKRKVSFQATPEELILTGPIIGLANPLAKCPNRNSRTKNDYEDIDLVQIPDDYLPRSNYTPGLPWYQYQKLVRSTPWDRTIKHIDCSRIGLRRRVDSGTERTLQCCLMSKGLAHVHGLETVSFKNLAHLITVCTLWNSLPYDFVAKSFQVRDMIESFTSQLAIVDLPDVACHRMLQLNCLTNHYAPIWNELACNYSSLGWSATHIGLELENPLTTTVTWNRNCGLRTDLTRRQALLEVDVLVAMALGLTLDELIQIYRLVFPVLYSYEQNTWYDQSGRIVWSNRNGKGMSTPRAEWERNCSMQRGCLAEIVTIDFLPNGPFQHTIEYKAPFCNPNREEDYRVAWDYFVRNL